MVIYSTCLDCGGLLRITGGDDRVHPMCSDRPTKVERLCDEWRAAVDAGDVGREEELRDQIEQIDSRPPRLLDAALAYAAWGWSVFPLKAGDKRPATRNGFKDATCDADQIRQWWGRNPNLNIGLPTGQRFDVVDIDVPDGVPTFRAILDQPREVHGFAVTASGGVHLYITPTGKGCSTRWQPGADFRGRGGYVVAPPSTLGRPGRSWSWMHKPSPIITGRGETYGR